MSSMEENVNIYNDEIMNPLSEPSKHSLSELFNELKFGRPASDQRLLNALSKAMQDESISIVINGEKY